MNFVRRKWVYYLKMSFLLFIKLLGFYCILILECYVLIFEEVFMLKMSILVCCLNKVKLFVVS